MSSVRTDSKLLTRCPDGAMTEREPPFEFGGTAVNIEVHEKCNTGLAYKQTKFNVEAKGFQFLASSYRQLKCEAEA